ncbi:uncharacterized protein BXZ73DRAFT_98029 [Epithele typhae]|uniref:uncharacterized protein n=1 Tax=Epithele typhae TaxID=378194 RepID=UPI002007D1CC|nr:uncharacterized protein BXZ73DRAFT_98029 [Epithele typhae]KAH9941641.1 hypothetical protein BXZ73DRAFT_98029 [Epithele typhae]
MLFQEGPDPLIGLLALFSSTDDARIDPTSTPKRQPSDDHHRTAHHRPLGRVQIRPLALARWNDDAATIDPNATYPLARTGKWPSGGRD